MEEVSSGAPQRPKLASRGQEGRTKCNWVAEGTTVRPDNSQTWFCWLQLHLSSILLFMQWIITLWATKKKRERKLHTLKAGVSLIPKPVYALWFEHRCTLQGQVMFIRGCREHCVQQSCCAVWLPPSDNECCSALKGTVQATLDTSVLCWGGLRWKIFLIKC